MEDSNLERVKHAFEEATGKQAPLLEEIWGELGESEIIVQGGQGSPRMNTEQFLVFLELLGASPEDQARISTLENQIDNLSPGEEVRCAGCDRTHDDVGVLSVTRGGFYCQRCVGDQST